MRKTRCRVAEISELEEGVGRVFALGADGGECALFLHQGKCYATGTLCPHQNASLDSAPCENGQIICRRHGYRFDLKTGDCLTIGGYGIPVYESAVEEGVVYVSYWQYDE